MCFLFTVCSLATACTLSLWEHKMSKCACSMGFADTAFALHGVVSRPQLLRMLKHRIGFCSHDPRMPAPPSKNRIPASQVRAFPPS